MGKSKAVSKKKTVAIPADLHSDICQLVEAIGKERAEAEVRASAWKQECEARQHREDHPTAYICDADIKAVTTRLWAVFESLRAIHHLASDKVANEDETESEGVAIREMARASIRGLDACLVRLTGGTCAGNFATEFDYD